ncbi:uncharacterized protein LOC131152332 isoform X2 [Malania oleifera]|uniref:uncharacterized protein LOC131152332 isoform X2 n=1 Tax=Malania oleifera TaxID=397392 RepID=UPI0025AE16E6|nr:uncharacterized protein LOC131152332 isoform X2 [Malania oleifera]
MVWEMNHHLARGKRSRVWGGAFLCWLCLMMATPKIPHSPRHHIFADMRNFLGVPNTLNVFTNFPFLVIGVLGLVFCLQGDFFLISSRGEFLVWAWFYAGITAMAFGSAYYHLKPDDNRVMWDSLPMIIAYSSLFSALIVERVGEVIGLACLLLLLGVAVLSTVCERWFNDLRLCMMFQLIPCVAIPVTAYTFLPKYTHSKYWLWASGVYLLAKFEAVADKKIYNISYYFMSGHSLEHLCLVMVPVLLTHMLMFRSAKYPSNDVLRASLPTRTSYCDRTD